MNQFTWTQLTAIFVLVLALNGAALAEEETQPASDTEKKQEENFQYTVKNVGKLAFRVPEDMPIEKRGGVIAPIPFDEYVYKKLKQISMELDQVETRLTTLETEVKGKSGEKKVLAAS